MAHSHPPAIPHAVLDAEKLAYREWLRTLLDARWGELNAISYLMGGKSPF